MRPSRFFACKSRALGITITESLPRRFPDSRRRNQRVGTSLSTSRASMKWQSVQSINNNKDMRQFIPQTPKRKVLVYSFDIMLGDKLGEKFFATLTYKIRKNIFTNSYVIDEEELERYVYSKYPSLRGKKWHIENNPQDTFESEKAQPTIIKPENPFKF